MSYLRAGHALIYFEGFSEAYIFLSCGESGKENFVEDYGYKYEDNPTFAELLVEVIRMETEDEDYAWKIAGILEKKLVGVKRREKPLTFEEYYELTNKSFESIRKEREKGGLTGKEDNNPG